MATVYSTQRTNNRATPVAMNKANELGVRTFSENEWIEFTKEL